MSNYKWPLRRLGSFLFALMIAPLFVVVSSGGDAQAAGWPVEINSSHYVSGGTILEHGDGSVTYAAGSTGTYTPSGLQTQSKPFATETVSNSVKSTSGVDGTLFTNYQTLYNGSQTSGGLEAVKNGVRLWDLPSPSCTYNGTKYEDFRWPSLSYETDVLFAVRVSPCPAEPSYLMKINSSTGTVLQSVEVTNWDSTQWNGMHEGTQLIWLTPDNGVRLLDGTEIKSFDNNLVLKNNPVQLPSGARVLAAAANGNGDMYVAVPDAACSDAHKVHVYRADGTSSIIDVSSYCFAPSAATRATPDGGIVTSKDVCSWGSCYSTIYSFSSSGQLRYQFDPNLWNGYGSVSYALLQVDANGTMLYAQTGKATTGDLDRNVVVHTVSPTDVRQQVFSTESLGVNGQTDQFTLGAVNNLQLGNGRFHLLVCNPNCDTGSSRKIHEIPISGLTMDYPRSAMMDVHLRQLSYVALGDSFSSGEGVTPFIPGTDTSTNDCHRSEYAYPMLLDDLLNLQAFVACSGASSYEMIHGKSGESGQLDVLDETVDVVTISVGGNDIDFRAFVIECLASNLLNSIRCVPGGDAHDYAFGALPTLSTNLVDTSTQSGGLFNIISTQAPNADVYVVGYPMIVPGPGEPDDFMSCSYLDDDEKLRARALIIELNQIIRDAVDLMGVNFHYVDPLPSSSPFWGKSLCSSGTYFNGAMLPQEYSYHPNAQGQNALAELIRGNM